MSNPGILSQEELSLASECISMALEYGAAKARATLNKSLMNLVATLDGEVDRISQNLDRSITLAIFADGRFGTFSTNKLDRPALREFVRKAVGTVRMLAPDECRDLPSTDRTEKGALTGMELGLYDDRFDGITPSERRDIALRASLSWNERNGNPVTPLEMPGKWKMISEEGEYSDSVFDTLVTDSQGTSCRHTETSFEYGVEVTVEDGAGNKYSNFWWDSTPTPDALDAASCGEKALRLAVGQIGPEPCGSARRNMVVSCEVASRLVTPLLNALAGSSIQQHNSFLEGSLGKRVFSEGLTITDEPRTPGLTGCRLFDSEGVATSSHEIICRGVVKEYFLNTYMAAKMDMSPTIEDATRPVVAGWPEPGLGRDEILRMCGSGILVTAFNGGNSNSVTGDFSFGIEGFEFEDGKITHPVREMLITGNLVSLWNNLVAAGGDARPCMSKLTPTLAFSNVDFSG